MGIGPEAGGSGLCDVFGWPAGSFRPIKWTLWNNALK